MRKAETEDAPDPDVLASVEHLFLFAHTLVEGLFEGHHRTAQTGCGTEFVSFRQYVQGDDIRLVDWKLWARTDHYYLRQFVRETSMPVYLVIDASGSMGFGGGAFSKFDYARLLLSAFAYLSVRQHDAPGLVVCSKHVTFAVEPRTGRGQLPAVLHELAGVRPQGLNCTHSELIDACSAFRRKGLVVVASDFFWEPDELDSFLGRCRGFGHDVCVCAIHAPEELSFPYQGGRTFLDLETGSRINVSCEELRSRFLARMAEHTASLEHTCECHAASLLRLTTSDSLHEKLGEYLDRRRFTQWAF